MTGSGKNRVDKIVSACSKVKNRAGRYGTSSTPCREDRRTRWARLLPDDAALGYERLMRHLGRIVEDAVANLATLPQNVAAGRKTPRTRGIVPGAVPASKLLSGLLLLIRP